MTDTTSPHSLSWTKMDSRRCNAHIGIILLVSVFLNCILILLFLLPVWHFLPSPQFKLNPARAPPSIAGLQYNKQSIYTHHTPYWSTNASEADAMWDSLSTDSIVVALSDSYTSTHRLPPSARFPWNPSYGRYYIRGLHELHCLKYVRRYVTDWQRGKPEVLVGEHVLHCLDSLRQSTMCRADDTVLALGDGDPVVCRDWDALIEWSEGPERNGCHATLDEYGRIRHNIERFAFCPDASPFREAEEAYFAENGHLNPWA